MEATATNCDPRFAAQGVFLNLLRRSLDVQFFHILREILVEDVKSRSVDDHLRESLLRDSTSRLAELESRNLPGVLKNLERYITIVFHREYSKDLIAGKVSPSRNIFSS